MSLIGVVALAGMAMQALKPVLWLAPSGELYVAGKAVKFRATAGVRRVRFANGFAFDFDGSTGALMVPDMAELHLTGSFTISSWIYLRKYAPGGPETQSQILFRGDDRNENDPYTLTVRSYGAVEVGVENGTTAGGEVPLNRWAHVLGSYSADTGDLRLWVDGECVGQSRTSRKPLDRLEEPFVPGVGIGNVQNDAGPHHQPFNGYIADLRLYNRVYTPLDLDMVYGPWGSDPPVREHESAPIPYTVN